VIAPLGGFDDRSIDHRVTLHRDGLRRVCTLRRNDAGGRSRIGRYASAVRVGTGPAAASWVRPGCCRSTRLSGTLGA
jgi:hypothetical protein